MRDRILLFFLVFFGLFNISLSEESTSLTEKIKGKIVPTEYKSFYAPMARVSIRGWNANWGGVKPTFLAEEGKNVTRGALIADFNMEFKDIRDWLRNMHASAKSEKDSILGKIKEDIERYEDDYKEKISDVKKIEFDLLKKPILSEREFRMLEMDLSIAKEMLNHVSRIAELQRQHYGNGENYHNNEIEAIEHYISNVEKYEKEFKLFAEDDGYIFYPKLPFRQRKAQIGDWIKSGAEFMRLCIGNKKEVEFYLPEEKLSLLAKGDNITIEIPNKKITTQGKVIYLNDFPELAGLITDDFSNPFAFENVYIARASIPDDLDVLAGSEVTVVIGIQE